MSPEEFERQAATILESFNFERVAQIMIAMDWKWHASEQAHVPTVDELRECAEMLLRTLKGDDAGAAAATASATGGLRAENRRGCLNLSFIIERREGLDAAEQEWRALHALDQAARNG